MSRPKRTIEILTAVLLLGIGAQPALASAQGAATENVAAEPMSASGPHGAAHGGGSAATTGGAAAAKPTAGPAPEPRDPHAYSDGLTLETGPYRVTEPLVLADSHDFGALLLDRIEQSDRNESGVADVQAWYGTDYRRLWIKSEAEWNDGGLEALSAEFYDSRAATRFWNRQLGLRFDTRRDGEDRVALAFGFQGLAPYFTETDATLFVDQAGAVWGNFEFSYDALLTQRLILQPRAEFDLQMRADRKIGVGRGLDRGEAGFRLRYEIDRQFAPYLGVQWVLSDIDVNGGRRDRRTRAEFVLGLRSWF